MLSFSNIINFYFQKLKWVEKKAPFGEIYMRTTLLMKFLHYGWCICADRALSLLFGDPGQMLTTWSTEAGMVCGHVAECSSLAHFGV